MLKPGPPCLWLLGSLCFAGWGCNESAPPPPLKAAPNENLFEVSLELLPPGMHPQTMERQNGSPLRYALSVPQGYAHKDGAPLVLSLHFGGGGRRRGGPVTPYYGGFMLERLVEPALKELNAVMIAPDSVGGRWNSEANKQAVLQLMDHIIQKYNIDRRRILVTGFSMGGTGTWHFAHGFPERFSAAIPIAARPPQNVDLQIPAYVIHSRDDEVARFAATADYVEQLRTAGKQVEFVALDGITHFETERFREPLQQAVPWIKQVWAAAGDE